MAPDRPHNDLPVIWLIVKQRSSATFFAMRFLPREGKIRLLFKNVSSFFTCQSLFAVSRKATINCVMSA
jgi:hypothetical protein